MHDWLCGSILLYFEQNILFMQLRKSKIHIYENCWCFSQTHANRWPCRSGMRSGRAEQGADVGKFQLITSILIWEGSSRKRSVQASSYAFCSMEDAQWKIFSPRQLP